MNKSLSHFTAFVLAACVVMHAGEAQPDTISGFDRALDEIVVTATRAPRLLKDVPVQTVLITSKDIARTDATVSYTHLTLPTTSRV